MPANKPTGPSHPGTLTLGHALDQSQSWTRLLQRLDESRARFSAIREQLPAPLRDQVRPGPLDDAGWSLLVPNGASAAKLRHLVPAIEATLQAEGWQSTSIRIRIQSK